MAYRPPVFHTYHAARESTSALSVIPNPSGASGEVCRDSRLGELIAFEAFSLPSAPRVGIELAATPEAEAVDTVIVSGHNFPGNDIRVFSNPVTLGVDSNTLLVSTVTEPVGTPIVRSFAAVGTDAFISLQMEEGGGDDSVVPELSEIFFTTAHQMIRGPEPGWDHPWQRSQRQQINDARVRTTSLLGAARKTYTLTWPLLEGPDRLILQNMRLETDDWSQPFWFTPPDDTYPTIFVELDRDSQWAQDAQNPGDTGTADTITLPLIEKLG